MAVPIEIRKQLDKTTEEVPCEFDYHIAIRQSMAS
jgi:hypothetical protein